jgi:hypothetical protein
MAVFTLLVLVSVLCSFLADIAYAFADPKIREQYQSGISFGKTTPEKATSKPSRKKRLRPLLFGLGSVTLVALIISVISLNPSANKPTQSLPVSTTIAQKVSFDEVELPIDAKIYSNETRTGERKAFLASVLNGPPAPKPSIDIQKESKRIIFTTSVPGIDLAKEYRQGLENQGWELSKTFPNTVSYLKFNYLFEKDDKFIWISADIYSRQGSLIGTLSINDRETYELLYEKVKEKDTVVAIVQGFKIPNSTG